MMNIEDYRQYAAECVRQAQSEETPEDKNILLNVALAWLRLAQQTQALSPEESPAIQPAQEPGPALETEMDEAASETETD